MSRGDTGSPGAVAQRRYLVELERPELGFDGVHTVGDRARRAARELAASGEPVRFLRTIAVPEDELCLLLWEAGSRASVEAAIARAGLVARSVAEAVPAGR
jgi:hypothetical protein